MILYLGRRLLGALGILLAICAITFTIFYLLPADPAVAACGKTCSPERVAEVKAAMGLDQPVWEQFATYVTGIFAGRDYGSGAGATHCGFPCLGYSYEYSLPVYFTSIMLIWGVVRTAGLLPYPSYHAFTDGPVAWASNLLLPWIALALLYAAMYARQSRNSMIEAMAEPYIRTARAKGLPPRTVTVKHGLRSGMTPILTIFGMDLGGLLAGAVITESIFGLPGVGRLFYDALVRSDQPVILGVTLLAATFIVAANLLVDVLYAYVDPRVRY